MQSETYGKIHNLTYRDCHYTDLPVYGFDYETPNYTIRLFSVSDSDGNAYVFDVTSETVLDKLIDYFRSIPEEHVVLFSHNLSFDFLVALNLDLHSQYPQFLSRECHWKYRDVRINYFNEHPYFGDIRYDDGKVIHLRDTFAYFGRIKLSKLAMALGVGEKLVPHGDDFTTDTISDDFREYAKVDAILAAKIGKIIMSYHEMEDVKLSVSSPNMAMMVFRKKFIPDGYEIICPSETYLRFWELSYHGGKNGCYRVCPTELKNVNLYDINSAYPYAMTQIPSFMECEYGMTKEILPGYVGIYKISARSKCEFNSTFDHDFTNLKRLDRTWITSYELESLLNWNCINDIKIHSFIYIKPQTSLNPFGDYARHYYEKKKHTPKDSPLYMYIKVGALNSLYGKLIERRDQDENDYSIRGPNYNPAIASLITGFTRAQMHDMEHRSNAIHSATDAVFTQSPMIETDELGGLHLEGRGTLKLFRNKLYLYYDQEGNIIKNARHGFHGSVEQLERIWETRTKNYEYKKIPTVGEYLLHKKLDLKLFGMNVYKAKVNIDWSMIDEL